MKESKKVAYALPAFLLIGVAIVVPALVAPVRAASYGSGWYLNVSEPTPNAVVTSPYLSINVQAAGYALDARYAGTPNIATIGHYHEILDGKLIDMTPTSDPTQDQISMMNMSDGLHTLTLVPSFNNHSTEMSNAVNIPFYYQGPVIPEPKYTGTPGASPMISIASPANGTKITGGNFNMTIDAKNFVICGGCYGKVNQPNVGHWHIFAFPANMMLPMSFTSMSAMMSMMMPHMLTMANNNTQQVFTYGLSQGWYTFIAILVQNNHMPMVNMQTYMPQMGTMTMETLYVTAASPPPVTATQTVTTVQQITTVQQVTTLQQVTTVSPSVTQTADTTVPTAIAAVGVLLAIVALAAAVVVRKRQ